VRVAHVLERGGGVDPLGGLPVEDGAAEGGVGDQVELAGVAVLAAADADLDEQGLDAVVVHEGERGLDEADLLLGDVDLFALHDPFGEVVERGAAGGCVVALLPGHLLERGDHGSAAGGVEVLDGLAVVGDVLGDGGGCPLAEAGLVEDAEDGGDAGTHAPSSL
jgi:hypothetical protein